MIFSSNCNRSFRNAIPFFSFALCEIFLAADAEEQRGSDVSFLWPCVFALIFHSRLLEITGRAYSTLLLPYILFATHQANPALRDRLYGSQYRCSSLLIQFSSRFFAFQAKTFSKGGKPSFKLARKLPPRCFAASPRKISVSLCASMSPWSPFELARNHHAS